MKSVSDLEVMRALLSHWLDWNAKQRADEGLPTDDETKVIVVPTNWPTRGNLKAMVDWVLGRAHCDVTKGEPFAVYIPMPEGSYKATATPETYIWRRRFYVPTRRRDSVSLNIEGGIPHAGKGENGWDCGDDGLWGISGETTEKAIANAVESVLKSRRRYGHDSHNTGRAPALVLNEAR